MMLEDLQDDVGLIERTLLKEGMVFTSKRVDKEDEFTRALEQFKPDVILSDHALPQFNSLEALQICRKRAVNVPFILVTGAVSEEFAVNCLKQGADDYVLKTNMVRLPAAIQNALKQRRLEAKRKKAEQTLRKQNDQLIKINKELDSFVYSVSHNLRAPLMSVLGLLNLVQLENMRGGERLEDYFRMMQHSIHKLDETLKDILDYSRNARSELQITDVEVKTVIEDSFNRMRYMEGSESVAMHIDVPGDLRFPTDPRRLSVIINNLLSNAIKYRDDGKSEKVVRVSAGVHGSQLEMRFSDNGIGIRPEYRDRVFEMFYRATERSEGAGLGLYIVRETVEKLRGNISLDSEPGAGTTFTVVLPNLRERVAESDGE